MRSVRILLIEDNPADVYLIQLALTESGIAHSLTRFESGRDAAETLNAPVAPDALAPDLVLMDLNTPRSNGFETVRDLRRAPQLFSVPFAILSSSRSREDKRLAADEGIRFIEKHSQLKEFLSTVGESVKEMLAPVWSEFAPEA